MELFTLTAIFFSYYIVTDLYNHGNAIREFHRLNLRLENIERSIGYITR